MFEKQFYPTPREVIELMQIDCNNKIVLEPSAGKGNIIDYLQENRAKEVIAFEINKDLQKIISSKCKLIGEDFLSAVPEQISHVDMIIMNPPFLSANKHIEHAFSIAPEGCEIISLCNYETINKYNRFSSLKILVKNYGVSSNLGRCFDNSERKTNVEVGLIRLFKPNTGKNNNFDGFYLEEDEVEEIENKIPGVIQYNEIRALVNRYTGAIKSFDKLDKIKEELLYTTGVLGIKKVDFKLGFNTEISTKEQFAKHLQKTSWSYIFDKMNMRKYVTSGVMEDINKFVETQQQYPFSEKNIYKMFETIVGTRQNTYNKALERTIDSFTRHTKENRFGVEGWVTNSGYMLNKKIIINRIVEQEYSGVRLKLTHQGTKDKLEDLTKVLCNIVGINFDTITPLNNFFRNEGGLIRGKWYDWEFFKIKCFKKGTMHLIFKNTSDWYYLNKAYGELKGFTLTDKYK